MTDVRTSYLNRLTADLDAANHNYREAVKFRTDARLAYEELADDADQAHRELERARKELLDFIETLPTEKRVAA